MSDRCKIELKHGCCLEQMKGLPDNSVDSVVTDPPYGLSFMGKKWDYDVPSEEVWRECLRVLKPGGHLLAFAGTRTQHRMAVRIEDAGFEIRDMIAWVYGSGFPKSHNIGKAVDKLQGNEREVVGETTSGKILRSNGENERPYQQGLDRITTDITKGTSEYEGWGTALKPALEPITVARKPFSQTVAANVLEWGTGAINVDACRVAHTAETDDTRRKAVPSKGWCIASPTSGSMDDSALAGRWPANICHDGSDEVVGLFPVTGASKATPRNNGEFKSVAKGRDLPHVTHGHDDNGGSAARFFYCAKASKKDRDEGCEGLEERQTTGGGGMNDPNGDDVCGKYGSVKSPSRNFHPTVKPCSLMQYLVKLVTPPCGTVLDPFMGSGSTGKAAVLEGFDFIGIEREAEYVEIARARLDAAKEKMQGQLF